MAPREGITPRPVPRFRQSANERHPAAESRRQQAERGGYTQTGDRERGVLRRSPVLEDEFLELQIIAGEDGISLGLPIGEQPLADGGVREGQDAGGEHGGIDGARLADRQGAHGDA